MADLLRTDSRNEEFKALVAQLDADLALRDGPDHLYYDQFNKIVDIPYALLAFLGNKAVGCGAIKEFDPMSMEVKRMYLLPPYRGRGIASEVLKGLEIWAKELGYERCVLETGKKQPEAIALYRKNGYLPIPNYGQYKGIDNSVCFEKIL
ncbi:MAG: GNAT family N-acetyltransferase [Sediminicola sp.]|tara:strand:+ start:7254 stop:7703 length:450 start_codon:yes stop_codon:yes gene_type:complete